MYFLFLMGIVIVSNLLYSFQRMSKSFSCRFVSKVRSSVMPIMCCDAVWFYRFLQRWRRRWPVGHDAQVRWRPTQATVWQLSLCRFSSGAILLRFLFSFVILTYVHLRWSFFVIMLFSLDLLMVNVSMIVSLLLFYVLNSEKWEYYKKRRS